MIGLCEPGTGRVGYFVMSRHPFGMSANVYNYNRRALGYDLLRPSPTRASPT